MRAAGPGAQGLRETSVVTVRRNSWIVDPHRVQVIVRAITPTSTILAIDALCKSAFEDPPRSSILIEVSRALSAVTTAGS